MPRDAENASITMAERAARVAEVYKQLLKGISRPEIIQFCQEKYNVVENTVDRYIESAKKDLTKRLDATKDHHFALMQHRLEDLYKRTMKLQDYKTALSVLKEYGTLMNLYPSKRHEVSGPDGSALKIHVTYGAETDGGDDATDGA